MSQENVEVAREVISAWNEYDLGRWLGRWHPDCVWVPRLRVQVEGVQSYRGHEGLRRYWAEEDAVFHGVRVDISEIRAVGEEESCSRP